MSFISSPMYNLSKFLARALSPLEGRTASHVSSSTDFITFTKTVPIPHGFALVSYDVFSLFTNVPTDLVVEMTKRRSEWDDCVLDEVGIPADINISLLQLCFSSTDFGYNGECYKRTHGTAMGSPASMVVANTVMEKIESQVLATSPVNCTAWKRYAHNAVCVVPEDKVKDMLTHINLLHDSIQFTCELETGASISFLDDKITCQQDDTPRLRHIESNA